MQKRTYTLEFKREAVRLVRTSGKPITQIARELGISDASIHQWRKELAEHGPEAFPGSGHQTAIRRRKSSAQTGIGAHTTRTRYTKKNSPYLLARPAVRYQAVEAFRKEYPVSVLCETLGVSLSGYYAWKNRPLSQHQREDRQLAERMQAAYYASRQVYGSPRIHAELHEQGLLCSRRRVARLMRERGLSARRRRHRTITTQSVPGARVAPNRLKQEFTASRRLGKVDGRYHGDLDVTSGDWMGDGCEPR